MATVNIGISVSLAKHVGVTYAPAIIAVSDGHLNYFTGSIVIPEIKKFLKTVLPAVTMVVSDMCVIDVICRYFSLQIFQHLNNLLMKPSIIIDLVL